MHETSHATPAGNYGDSLTTVREFARRFPNIYPRESRIRWLLRDRAVNGLLESSAVVEVYASGDKPALYIDVPRWFQWMRTGGARGSLK